MAYHPTYKSQVYVPIKKDSRSFEERQRSIWDEIHNDLDRDFISRDVSMPTRSAKPGGGGAGQMRSFDPPIGGGSSGGIWDDMHARMERRRHDWEEEVERMRKGFLQIDTHWRWRQCWWWLYQWQGNTSRRPPMEEVALWLENLKRSTWKTVKVTKNSE